MKVRPERVRLSTNDDLRAIVEEHGASMYRVALSIVRDPAMAEDVVQDSLLKVWESIGDWRGEAPLRNWIIRITHNTAVSTLRRVRDEAWDPSLLPDSHTSGLVEQTVEARDDLATVRAALDALDPLSRSILTLREFESMSYEQIAATLGITLGQVKIRLLRARRSLAASVQGGEQ